MEVVYSRSPVTLSKGQVFRNPRHFFGPVEGATKVLLDGEYPRIVRAYEGAGVPVSRIDALVVDGPVADLPEHEPGAVVVPEDWRDLPWSAAEGPTLRAVASAIRNGPVSSKADAIEVVEAELARREP